MPASREQRCPHSTVSWVSHRRNKHRQGDRQTTDRQIGRLDEYMWTSSPGLDLIGLTPVLHPSHNFIWAADGDPLESGQSWSHTRSLSVLRNLSISQTRWCQTEVRRSQEGDGINRNRNYSFVSCSLSLSVSLCLCLSACLSLSLSLCVRLSLSLSLSVSLFVFVCPSLSISLSATVVGWYSDGVNPKCRLWRRTTLIILRFWNRK